MSSPVLGSARFERAALLGLKPLESVMPTSADFNFHFGAGARRLFWLTCVVVLIRIYDYDLIKHPLQSRFAKSEFWEAATGRPVWFILVLTLVTALSPAIKTCERLRRPKLFLHDHRICGEAFGQSLTGYLILPILAMTAVRYLMVQVGIKGFFWFLPFSVILILGLCIINTHRIVWMALRLETKMEGETQPVIINAKYEFPIEWKQVLTAFGAASRLLRTATYKLVRSADPDPSLDRLSPMARTRLMAEEAQMALRGRNLSSLDVAAQFDLRELRKQMKADVAKAEERIAGWREELRSLEGPGPDRLPPGTADLLPAPTTVQEKITIKKLRISQIERV